MVFEILRQQVIALHQVRDAGLVQFFKGGFLDYLRGLTLSVRVCAVVRSAIHVFFYEVYDFRFVVFALITGAPQTCIQCQLVH